MSPRQIKMSEPTIGIRERIAVDAVLRSKLLAQGKRVAAFETKFSKIIGSKNGVALNSGTSALHLLLLAHQIGPGDEVIVPSFTFAATANAVALTGATPVFADIEVGSMCLDPIDVARKISARTRAVMPVHLFGNMANMLELQALTQENDLLLLEDAAQAHLASFDGKLAGTWGDGSAFSFYPTKNMTSGEGGMVCVGSDEIARQLRLLRNQGMEKRYENEIWGFNNRMTDIHAAIGIVQLSRIEKNTLKRRSIAGEYSSKIKGVTLPENHSHVHHVYHQYTMRVAEDQREAFRLKLTEKGIPTDIYYPIPVHRLPSFASKGVLPNTELVARTCLSLPMHPGLTRSQVSRVISSVNEVSRELGL
jgi:dTDP-4-amino-4,6-dideoxygalactose transaminase